MKVEDLLKNVDLSILNSLEFEKQFNNKLMKLVNIMMIEMDKSNSDIEDNLREINSHLLKIVLKLMKLEFSTQI